MEMQLLRKPEDFPTKEVFKKALGGVYSVLEEVERQLTGDDFALTLDWQYYNDGKAWLCKVVHKKKTVCWLSVWEGFFQTGFFFLERHLEGIAALALDENSFTIEKACGKLIPMIFRINDTKQIPDFLTMVKFKKGAK